MLSAPLKQNIIIVHGNMHDCMIVEFSAASQIGTVRVELWRKKNVPFVSFLLYKFTKLKNSIRQIC